MNDTLHNPAPWILEARRLPLAFAQVREDPLIDLWVVRQLVTKAHVLMIASGGCTACLLATAPNITQLDLIDPNPAQLALTRLKIRLLQTEDPERRLGLLGHTSMATHDRQCQLSTHLTNLQLSPDILGPPEYVAQVGPDYAGRYERVFATLQKELTPYSEDLNALLNLTELSEQQKRIAPSTELGDQLDRIFDSVMALPNLVRLFGKEATRNPVQIFSRHFANRVRHVLSTIPAKHNPYLWQMLLGRYPQNHTTPWLHQPLTEEIPAITCTNQFMTEALDSVSSQYDFIHLSNILDWLSPEQAQGTLEKTWHALKPGGWTLIRQLNSDLDIRALKTGFQWDFAQSHDLHVGDRSFFYRSLHLGRKS